MSPQMTQRKQRPSRLKLKPPHKHNGAHNGLSRCKNLVKFATQHPRSPLVDGDGAQVVNSVNQMDLLRKASRFHAWHWDIEEGSQQVLAEDGSERLRVCFHPLCSESTAAVRGSEPLQRNGNYYYWEVTVLGRAYGTSVMFGLCTKSQSLQVGDYCNLIGLDSNGWSLSHKGQIWHNNKSLQYTAQFAKDQPITIGLLFNTMRGELTYFMDGNSLGVAFRGLNDVTDELYPVIGSTSKCTRMHLTGSYCGYMSLLERSCFTLIRQHSRNHSKLIEYLQQFRLPKSLILYIAQEAKVCDSHQTDKNKLST